MFLSRLRFGLLTLLVCGVPWIFVSCNSGSGRSSISGAVSYEGEPIDQGAIIFMPVESAAVKPGGRIKDGHYEIEAEKGATLGEHKVLLFWEKKTGKTYIDRDTGDEYDRRTEGLPTVYQSEETPLQVEIVRGPNVHDFNLTESK